MHDFLEKNTYAVVIKMLLRGHMGILAENYVPPTEGGGHIVFGADPVGVHVASFRCDIF